MQDVKICSQSEVKLVKPATVVIVFMPCVKIFMNLNK